MTNKIESWINNDPLKKLTAIREQYDPQKYPFILSIKLRNPRNSEIPLSIYKPTDYKDKISVYTRLIFDEEQKNSWNVINDHNFKEKILVQISEGLFVGGLVTRFYPNRNDLEQIILQDMIYEDGLSKDRLMNSITRVLGGYGYAVAVLIRHKILRKKFEPSDYV